MRISRHHWLLLGTIALGVLLRFYNLESKPIWADEVITALFSLGRSYSEVPLNSVFPVSVLEQVLTLKPETTCAQIVQTVSIQSVHPPLFFCWMHRWLNWLRPLDQSWVWKLRALPAIVGAISILAVYQLNRLAFFPLAGLFGAALMAVSPFAVYLSQEARHYTLPMLLVILALSATHHLQYDLIRHQFRPVFWLAWVAINSLGFYVHYFFLLAFVAQVLSLVIEAAWQARPKLPARRSLAAIVLAALGVCLTYAPWLPTLISHSTRPETDWMKPFEPNWTHALAPLYQLPLGWILMVVALPVEGQPGWIAIPAGVFMLGFALWLVWQMAKGLRQLWQNPQTQAATRMLGVYSLVVVAEFLAIAYVLGKDLTLVPRYNFIYFPAVCALLGASLTQLRRHGQREILTVLLVGLLSSGFVVTNLAFQKPYHPDRVARQMQFEPARSRLTVMAYSDLQDVALGLSFALALDRQDRQQLEQATRSQFVFLARSPEYDSVWRSLSGLKHSLPSPLNLWIVAPGLRRKAYPPTLSLTDPSGTLTRCQIDPTHHYRIGIPYQLYRCE